MTGVFTAEINSQIAGQSTAPLASQTATVKSVSSASATTTSKATAAAASASATTTESGAMGMRIGWAAAALSALVGVAMF